MDTACEWYRMNSEVLIAEIVAFGVACEWYRMNSEVLIAEIVAFGVI